MKQAIFVLLFLAVVFPAWARGFTNGNELYGQCQAEKTDPVYYQKHANCLSYISGVSDATEGPAKGMFGITFCLPDNVTQGQIADVVKKWLSDNPQDRHFTASWLVVAALAGAWPCHK